MSELFDLSSSVLSDYEKVLETGKYTDISINVGKEPNNKLFTAHTLVLCMRSVYFETQLNVHAEDVHATMDLEDITPNIFEILLRFIYTGKVSHDSCVGLDWIALLEGASKLKLDELITAVGDHLIYQNEQLIRQNVLAIYKCTLSSSSPNRLLDYCNRIMVTTPEVVFRSSNITNLPKPILITLLKNEKLNMNEADIWKSVVKWAIKQVPDLVDDPSKWSPDDIKAIVNILDDCIPYVRFFGIPAADFSEKIVPYHELLPKPLWQDILLHLHLGKEMKPSNSILPPRIKQLPDVDSVIISKQQAAWIVQKIAEKQQSNQSSTSTEEHDSYKLSLLFRRSRDKEPAEFQRKCANKGPTIIVGKVLANGEILGGYNPITLSFPSKSRWVSTMTSFVFTIDKNKLEKSIVSSVVDRDYAICEHANIYPSFGAGPDLCFRGTMMSAEKKSYEHPISFISGKFPSADWEVFLVSQI